MVEVKSQVNNTINKVSVFALFSVFEKRITILKDLVKSWEKVPGEPFGELLNSWGTFWRTFAECKDPAPQMEGSQ